jgi:hypothetical protein
MKGTGEIKTIVPKICMQMFTAEQHTIAKRPNIP